ncbi:MAG TPA: LppA family lipoprotein [Dermatophilaceae bacterium]|jgi:Lipoprotein confined to pathogenic Mycobacterium|nr:LppA family lipoprotein [Dermatophilaceae bacterium]
MNTVPEATRASGVSAVRVIATLLTMLIITGCSSAAKENRMKDAFHSLMKRPNLTVVEADYQSMYETIRSRLVAEVGVSAWLPDVEPIRGTACSGEISNLDGGQERLYNAGSSSGNLPDAKWDQAVRIVAEVAKEHGFGAPEVVVSGPSDHEVQFQDTYRGYLTFGTGYNTILYGGTGCHLTEEAHQRGTYLPPKKY